MEDEELGALAEQIHCAKGLYSISQYIRRRTMLSSAQPTI